MREIIPKMLSIAHWDCQTFASAAKFLELKEITPNSCLVLDNHMPGLSGLELQKELVRRGILIPIVFISGDSRASDIVQAIKGGAYQFLQKPFTQAELVSSIEEALLAQKQANRLLEADEERSNKLKLLTPRETQVLELLCLGNSNKLIAKELEISISTVEFHRANLNKKLCTNTLADLMLIYRASLSPEVKQ
jgi:FixJ family two-component response regulator